MTDTDFKVALIAGGAAGTSVDVLLFPLDTIKTRMKSHEGFWKIGGFRGIYSGLLSVTLGSAPTAAMFFCTYELVKNLAHHRKEVTFTPAVHMFAASLGEVTACLIRVPVEVIKQRAQASPQLSSYSILQQTLSSDGFRGLYRGYLSTVIREIPFSLIQFPLWEYLKKSWAEQQHGHVHPWQSSICGAVAGCIASGLTTPLDVAKTRIMLAKTGTNLASGSIVNALKIIFAEKGIKGLFAGLVPRMTWISIGGAVFLGVYDKVKVMLSTMIHVPVSID